MGRFWYTVYGIMFIEGDICNYIPNEIERSFLIMESKKQLILLILNELNVNSDEDHPITQSQIAKNISGEKYLCDRKTVLRNIKFLMDMGYPIRKHEKQHGFYMDNKIFSVEDIGFIQSAILSAEGKSEAEKSELIKKVTHFLTKLYRRN